MQFALGSLYEDAGDLDKARACYANVLKADGKNLDALLAMGRVEIKAGNPQKGLDPLDQARHIAIDLDNPGAAGADSAGHRHCLQVDEQADRGVAQL